MLTSMLLSITHWHGTSLPLSRFLSAVRQWVYMMNWDVLYQHRYFNFVSFCYISLTCQFSLTGSYLLSKWDFPTCPSRVVFTCLFSQQRDFFYCAKGPAALVVCLVCRLHVCCVWPGASYLIFLSLKTLFQINPFMLKPCLTIDSPVCTIGRLPWGGRRRESRNVGLGNWCQSAAIWQLILS